MKKQRPFLQRRFPKHAFGRFAPKFSVVFGFGSDAADDYYLSLPFGRSLPAILISGAFLAVFSFPLFAMGEMLGIGGDDSLSSLVANLFTLFWMLGWLSGVAVLLLVFLCLSFGKESLHVANNKLSISIGIPGFALSGTYDENLIRKFRYIDSDIAAGKKWRGNHIAFDYGDSNIAFGSNISAQDAPGIIARLKVLFPMFDAAPAEVTASIAEVSDIAEEPSEPEKPITNSKPVRWNSLSSLTLILANLIPLLGVLIAGWDIGQIMLLFWAESAIVGYYNLCKMWKIGRWSLLFYGPFFVGHYGAFMAVHLLFIYALFIGDIEGDVDVSRNQVFNDMQVLWPALLGLLISHGISYYVNFVKTNKGQGRTMALQMQEPYRRVMIMHVTLIFGGFLTLSLGSNVGALMLLLLLKIAADLRSHVSQHSSKEEST